MFQLESVGEFEFLLGTVPTCGKFDGAGDGGVGDGVAELECNENDDCVLYARKDSTRAACSAGRAGRLGLGGTLGGVDCLDWLVNNAPGEAVLRVVPFDCNGGTSPKPHPRTNLPLPQHPRQWPVP